MQALILKNMSFFYLYLHMVSMNGIINSNGHLFIIDDMSIRRDIYMRIELETSNGEVVIESEVIAQFAGLSAIECFGIVGMATVNMKDGFVKLLRGDSVSKGVNVVIGEDNSISIDFHIIVAYGVSISTVAENLMSTVRYKVEEFTGMQVENINVFVEGVRVID